MLKDQIVAYCSSHNQQISNKILKNLRLKGIEPLTFGTEIQHSIQLSYKRFYKLDFYLNYSKESLIKLKTQK
jgi:hypothetical protein